jgi:hypothetical protein
MIGTTQYKFMKNIPCDIAFTLLYFEIQSFTICLLRLQLKASALGTWSFPAYAHNFEVEFKFVLILL